MLPRLRLGRAVVIAVALSALGCPARTDTTDVPSAAARRAPPWLPGGWRPRKPAVRLASADTEEPAAVGLASGPTLAAVFTPAQAEAPSPPRPDPDRPLLCCDGTRSPSCTCGDPRRGCCSHHRGVCGCAD